MRKKLLSHEENSTKNITLHFSLFKDTEFVLSTTKISSSRLGLWTWNGCSANHEDIYGSISIAPSQTDYMLAGVIYSGSTRYILTSEGNAITVVQEVSLTYCETVQRHIPPFRQSMPPQVSYNVQELTVADKPDDTIDVLIVYPTQLESGFSGGINGLTIDMHTAASLANIVFTNNKIPSKVEIIGVQGVSKFLVPEKEKIRGMLTFLYQINSQDGTPQNTAVIEELEQIREKYQADIIVVVIPDAMTYPPAGASVVAQPPGPGTSGVESALLVMALKTPTGFDLVSDHTFTHELGHLMGARHDRYGDQPRSSGEDPTYDFARGFITGDAAYGSVMSYRQPSTELVPAYSSPEFIWKGHQMGVPLSENQPPDVARL